MNRELGKKLFVNFSSIVLIYIATVAAAHVPVVGEHYLMLGVLGGAYGFDKVKELVGKLPGIK